MSNKYSWIRDDFAPFDIWLRKSEIEPIKGIIAMGRGAEYQMLFGNVSDTKKQRDANIKKYEDENKDRVTFEEVLEFQFGMFGNNPNRTITILDGDKQERYKRVETKTTI